LNVTVFTDPGCPFGFNAQRQDLQLLWHYGHALSVERRMIVLSEVSSTYEERGFSRDAVVRSTEQLSALYGMPMTLEVSERAGATIGACRAYVAAEVHDPARAGLLLRALRVRAFSEGQALDERTTLHGAASDAGIEPAALDAWLGDDAVETRLRADMAAARDPLPEALALPHKLSKNGAGYRYSTASSVFEHEGRRIVAPGFQPFAVHEVAVANLAPAGERRPAPSSAEEVLAWAPYALATAEVAELRGVSLDAARAELEAAGARFAPAAGDGYWSKVSTSA
jgi:predicted DsbA family dithiol-disulfide isomerase